MRVVGIQGLHLLFQFPWDLRIPLVDEAAHWLQRWQHSMLVP
jgi:hypothetical protein